MSDAPDTAIDDDTGGRAGRAGRRLIAAARTPESLVTLVVVVVCTVFVFVELQPSQLLRDTTPAGGDMGAHVWLPAYLKRVLLPHFQIFGWTMDWYAGFPALTYYFPLPMVTIALVSYVIPYNIAFKLVSVAGLVALPAACWAFGRLARMRFPGPACMAAASLAYLFSRDFTIYGGNIASTMAGEFSFSISLAFAMVFLGLAARGMQTGTHRAIAAVVLALCGLSHVLPLFFAIGGAVILLLMHPDGRRARWTVPVLVVAGLLIAFWALPFELRLPYATNMGYGKITTYLTTLFPKGDTWLFILGGVGGILALARRNRIGTFLLLATLGSAVVFRFAPNARLWNARVLPFWFLCLYLLVGVAFSEAGCMAAEWWAARRRERAAVFGYAVTGHGPGATAAGSGGVRRWGTGVVPVVTLLVALVWVGFPLRILPFGHTDAAGRYDWLGLSSADSSFIPDWVHWNYSGYQSSGKSSRATYFALINEMRTLGRVDGCGRAMYEYEPSINDMGTPDALMLLPYWTSGCIGSMEGLYYESSATTPYHFLNAAELSQQPSNPMAGLQYPSSPDVTEGVEHLQMFGVKYYMAVTPSVQKQADADPSLRYLASVGPYPTATTNSSNQTVEQNQTWRIYEVLDSPLVQPLANAPVVATGAGSSGAAWLRTSQAWYLDPSQWKVVETASGPAGWARVPAGATSLPVRPEPTVHVTDVRQGEESISFDVDRTGVPVLVKTSYFPNWQASGAGTVYRATPNLMVVVPTSHHVTLSYGYTPVDWAGLLLSLLGLGGLGLLWRGAPSLALLRRGGAPRRGARRDSPADSPEEGAASAPESGEEAPDGDGTTAEPEPVPVGRSTT